MNSVNLNPSDRPWMRVVLAMSADGKIGDVWRSPARFGSAADQRHLQEQVAACDATLFGANTLKAYGTALRVTAPDLLHQRQQQGKPAQPIQIVCSASGNLDRQLRFFQQSMPRWLLTTPSAAQCWQNGAFFDRILTHSSNPIDWKTILPQFAADGISHLAVLGGGELIASLLVDGCVDELYLTVCPLLLGGQTAPTPVAGLGFPESLAPQLRLQSVRSLDQEVFLHYRVCYTLPG